MVHVGDKLKYIASYFGTTVATIRDWNPWLGATGTPNPGQTLRIPPP
jgi:LysM repeat protein